MFVSFNYIYAAKETLVFQMRTAVFDFNLFSRLFIFLNVHVFKSKFE